MITKIRYKNFKALRNTTLPLGRFTLIVGANGTGKSTAINALEIIKKPSNYRWSEISSKTMDNFPIEITVEREEIDRKIYWEINSDLGQIINADYKPGDHLPSEFVKAWQKETNKLFCNSSIFSFDSDEIAEPVYIKKDIVLGKDGKNLAGVLWQIQNSEPEIFEQLNKELYSWFPEFDRVVFEIPEDGQVSFLLRTKVGKHKIKAKDLSDGTLVALAYLTLAYLPNPPKIVAFEEPEKGIHPRLLENIQEAMYRLAYPENYGEKREPVQVIATTHSPYLLDLYKEHPEEIVIASKDEKGVHFERLIDKPHYEEVIKDAPLGDIWYSGILGGVPIQP